MKILYIHEYFTEKEKNGANIVAFNNYYSMIKNGHECYFFAINKKPYLANQKINYLFPCSHIENRGSGAQFLYRLNSLFNISAKNNLNSVLKDIKPDIVHIHSTLELSYSVLLSLKKYNIPYVLTIHDTSFSCPVMSAKFVTCSLCTKNVLNCIKNKCSRNNFLNSAYMALKFFINKMLIKKYPPQSIIVPSYALKNYIQTIIPQKTECIVIPNSLDSVFEHVVPSYENKNYFLFVGRLIDVKGVSILLQAMKELPQNIELHIVGTGLQKDDYIRFIEENDLKNVKLLEDKNREELIKEYQDCIAVIVPSNLFESFGMINIEAFVNGKPVIASNIGAFPEVVENNINGLLFDVGSVEQLKNCILRYWNDRSLAIQHGKNGYNKVLQNYSEGKFYESLLAIYEDVIIKRG